MAKKTSSRLQKLKDWFVGYVKTINILDLFKPENLKKFFTKQRILDFLEREFVKAALKKIFGAVTPGGIQAWFVTFFLKEVVFDKALEPAIEKILREAGYIVSKIDGGIQIKKKDKAKEGQDETKYNDAIDGIIS